MSEPADAAPASETLRDIFDADGPLAGVLHGYAPREAQRTMAEAVAHAIATATTLVVEAGTGVGKTLAYLVPALLGGRRVIISTGTRNLQDQLFHRDLPTVTAALGQPVKTALLKGRSNYLCLYRLEQARHQALAPRLATAVMRVAGWALNTSDGDIAEYAALPEDHPVWPLVTSTADNCLGQECPRFGDCHVVRARRAAQSADLIVVNHHLLLADFTLKEEGFGELLPGADACIVDEAHQVPETAARFFGVRLASRQVLGVMSDLEAEAREAQLDATGLLDLLPPLRQALADFRETLGRYERRVNFTELGSACSAAMEALGCAIGNLSAALEALDGHTAGLDALCRRTAAMEQALAVLTDADDSESIRWVEVMRRGFALHSTPLEAAEQLREIMARRESAWVFTSATLTVGDSFDHFSQRMGLTEPDTLALGSPFDFERNALLYLPRDFPAPSSADYTERVVALARRLIAAADGGAFVLFTSHRALRIAAGLLADYDDHPVLVQGEAPRDELLRRFREHGRAVLLGTASFWEGVDVRGAALSLVIIDKLPFASPGDPVTEARLHALRRRGINPFTQHQLPQAVLALKQGVGRLIRDPQDTGVCVLCDPRVTGKGYGRVFQRSLPPMRRTDDEREAVAFLRRCRRP